MLKQGPQTTVIKPGLAWWLDRFGFVKRPAGTITWQNSIDQVGRPMTRANQDETRFFFQMWFFSYTPLFLYFLTGY